MAAHLPQALDDSDPIRQLKEPKFYGRVRQTLYLVGYLVKIAGQAAPEAIFAPPCGKARLPGMPEELPSFGWEEVFRYAVTQLDLPSSDERRERIEEFLKRLEEIVGERG